MPRVQPGGVKLGQALRPAVTFQVRKPSVLLQDGEELRQACPPRTLHVLCAGLWGQLHPERPAVRQEVQLVEEGRLVPGRQLAAGQGGTQPWRQSCPEPQPVPPCTVNRWGWSTLQGAHACATQAAACREESRRPRDAQSPAPSSGSCAAGAHAQLSSWSCGAAASPSRDGRTAPASKALTTPGLSNSQSTARRSSSARRVQGGPDRSWFEAPLSSKASGSQPCPGQLGSGAEGLHRGRPGPGSLRV